MKILAVDYGDARTGLAACDPGEMLASPVGTVEHWDPQKVAEEAAKAAKEVRAERIVVGHPLNMDGTIGPRAEKCQALAQRLRARTDLPVVLWDERRTTVDAHRILGEQGVRAIKRKDKVDAVAASLILEGYLARKRIQREQEAL